jgi:hypothetical protein
MVLIAIWYVLLLKKDWPRLILINVDDILSIVLVIIVVTPFYVYEISHDVRGLVKYIWLFLLAAISKAI